MICFTSAVVNLNLYVSKSRLIPIFKIIKPTDENTSFYGDVMQYAGHMVSQNKLSGKPLDFCLPTSAEYVPCLCINK